MTDCKDHPCGKYCANGWIPRFWDSMVTQCFMDAHDPFLACFSLGSISNCFCSFSFSRLHYIHTFWEEDDYFLGDTLSYRARIYRKRMAMNDLTDTLSLIL